MASGGSVAYECRAMLHTAARAHVALVPNALSRALAAHGVPRIDLTCTNPTEVGLGLDGAALRDALGGVDLGRYAPEPFGDMHARAAVAAMLARPQLPVGPDNVMLTASTSEAYAYLFKLLADPGDALLVPSPSYPLFDVLARLEGVRLVPYPLRFDGEWHIDLPALRALRSTRTRAIITVHPNNPTGSFVKRDELDAIAALGLPVISDEVFADYGFAGAPAVSTLAELGERSLVFRLGGLSKSLLLPHFKLAWTALSGPPAALAAARERLEHIADAFLSPNGLAQGALPALLAARHDVHAQLATRVLANRALLGHTLAGSAASLFPSEGGAMAIVRLPALDGDEAMCVRLLAERGVLVQPGYFYDLTDITCCVVSCLVRPEHMAQGAAALRAFVDGLG
jgi:alanine-synthesizing transaminase